MKKLEDKLGEGRTLFGLKKSQIWVETAVYTLLGILIITIVLAIATPQIEKMKDRSMIKQSMDVLETLDNKILDVEQSVGSVVVPQVSVGKGKFIINSTNDSINYVLENTPLEFSEVGAEVKDGNLVIKTDKSGKKFRVSLARYYSWINITYRNADKDVFLEAASIPYKIRIENKGKEIPQGKIVLDFSQL